MNLKLKALIGSLFILGISFNSVSFASNLSGAKSSLFADIDSDKDPSPETSDSENSSSDSSDSEGEYEEEWEEEEEEEEQQPEELTAEEEAERDRMYNQFIFGVILNVGANADNEDTALECLSQGIDVNCVYPEGQTPLHLAVLSGRTRLIRALLERGARLSAVNDAGQTPIHIAAIHHNVAIMRLLLGDDGSDAYISCLNTRDHSGRTAYKWALEKHRRDVALFLLSKGADDSI